MMSRVPVEKGEHEMRLVAEGSAQGLYLWGSPHLAAGRDRGPVILVTLDTTRRDALSIYGGPEAASPNIARLAESLTVFDHAWATSPWTLPSHASIFTGLYPTRHGAGIAVDPWIGPSSLRILVVVFRVGRYRWHSVLSLVDCWSRVCSLGVDHPPLMKAST